MHVLERHLQKKYRKIIRSYFKKNNINIIGFSITAEKKLLNNKNKTLLKQFQISLDENFDVFLH